MGYEWDPVKARSNAAKHRVHFGDAVAVLEDENAFTIRDPFSEEEERWITLGRDAFWALTGGDLCLASAKCAIDFSTTGDGPGTP